MKQVPVVTSVTFDGTISIVIGNVEYTYYLDAALIPRMRKLLGRGPWKMLNALKTRSYHFTKKEVII